MVGQSHFLDDLSESDCIHPLSASLVPLNFSSSSRC